ncbi:family 2 glycosyl transferase [Winogradskyella sp. PE311]|uniref:family 2 glycosyl transferase n=1 Tax=Winogradskyella sp. PE311 TaxID=3366943 RepID=UPI00397F7AB6
MRIGIIIIFNNNETHIDKDFIIKQINDSQNMELCLVDNFSKDRTLSLLLDIKESCEKKVSVVEIKKHASENAAKRAGARYMFNQYNLKHIGFINVNKILNGESLNTLVESVVVNHKMIIDLNLKTIERQKIKQSLFKSIFSIVDYLKTVNSKKSLIN